MIGPYGRISLGIQRIIPISRHQSHYHRNQNQQVIMIVICGFLHKVNCRPKYGKGSGAKSVPISQGNTNSQGAHGNEIQIHSYTGQRLQPVETNKIKSKFRIYQVFFDPTRGNGPIAFKAYQNTKKYPEN